MKQRSIRDGGMFAVAALVVLISTGYAAEPAQQRRVYLPFVARGQALPTIGGCTVFPADNPWNSDISAYPVDLSERAASRRA